MVGGSLSLAGGGSLLDGALLWWARGRCVWGCRCCPFALWAGVHGVVEKAIVDVAHPIRVCHVSCLVVGVVVVPCRSRGLGHSSSRESLLTWHTQMGMPRQPFGGGCRGQRLHCWLHCSCRCHGHGTHLVSCIMVVAVAEVWDSGGWQQAVGGAGWWWWRGKEVWHGLCQCFLIWQVPKRSYVNINVCARKCRCGAVG